MRSIALWWDYPDGCIETAATVLACVESFHIEEVEIALTVILGDDVEKQSWSALRHVLKKPYFAGLKRLRFLIREYGIFDDWDANRMQSLMKKQLVGVPGIIEFIRSVVTDIACVLTVRIDILISREEGVIHASRR